MNLYLRWNFSYTSLLLHFCSLQTALLLHIELSIIACTSKPQCKVTFFYQLPKNREAYEGLLRIKLPILADFIWLNTKPDFLSIALWPPEVLLVPCGSVRHSFYHWATVVIFLFGHCFTGALHKEVFKVNQKIYHITPRFRIVYKNDWNSSMSSILIYIKFVNSNIYLYEKQIYHFFILSR